MPRETADCGHYIAGGGHCSESTCSNYLFACPGHGNSAQPGGCNRSNK